MSAQSNDQQMEGVQDVKGKGKAPQNAVEESEESSDESAGEDQVRTSATLLTSTQIANEHTTGRRTYAPHLSWRDQMRLTDTAEEADEDNMEEIETSNIIQGSRTRGKTIDFAKANQELEGEDDEDEDDDFVDPDDEMKE